jgi:hypothetical protein
MARYTNDELLSHFVEGATTGKANSMAIEERGEWTLLWGYGHALYAARKANGPLYIYNAWYGYSSTTSTHLNKLKRTARSHYPTECKDGTMLRALVTGDGLDSLTSTPPRGKVVVVTNNGRPGTSYGKLETNRPELSELDGRQVKAPNGTG